MVFNSVAMYRGNDQRIALLLSPERGAASSYLSFSQQLLPRLLYFSYAVIAVQLRLCNSLRMSVRLVSPYAAA